MLLLTDLPSDAILLILHCLSGSLINKKPFFIKDPKTLPLATISKKMRALVLSTLKLTPMDQVPNARLTIGKGKGLMSRSEELGIRTTANHILGAFPPKDWIYLAVGSSATPILAEIQILFGQARVINMPLSGIREDNFEFLRDNVWGNEEKKSRLVKHFEHFLGMTEIGKRQVLLIDYVDKGFSLRLVRGYLVQYFKEVHKLDDDVARAKVMVYAVGSSVNLVNAGKSKELEGALFSIDKRENKLSMNEQEGIKAMLGCMTYEVFKARNYVLYGKFMIDTILGEDYKPPKLFLDGGGYQRLLMHLRNPKEEFQARNIDSRNLELLRFYREVEDFIEQDTKTSPVLRSKQLGDLEGLRDLVDVDVPRIAEE